MKKTLLILCALVCGTFAFAQSYTGNLHVWVNGDDDGSQETTITVAFEEEDNSKLDFTLHDFSITIGSTELDLGDLTVKGVDVGEEKDGVATFSCTEDHEVTISNTTWSMFISDISLTMTGDISATELYASMDIAATITLLGSYTITATFATSGYGLNGDYLIVNAESGYYLAGGLAWGTCAMEGGRPQFMTLEALADGTYTIDSHQSNGGNYHYLGTNRYLDNLAIGWTVEEVEGGYTLYYDGTSDGVTFTGYLTGAGFQTQVVAETTPTANSVWKLVSRDDIITSMENATVDQPVDVSALIPACEPKRNDWGNSWVTSGYGTTNAAGNVSLGQDGSIASCAESYHSNNGFDVRQTISSLPVGYYELTAQAFYRNDGGTVIPSMYITTGTSATDTSGSFENVDLPLHTTDADNMEKAYQELLGGLYPVSLTFIVDNEGDEFTVGFESNTTTDDQMWTIFGELGLNYMGTELPTLTAVTGTMNATVKSTMETAIATYEANKTSANYIAAEQAIFDAEESVAYYASITAIVENLDESGLAEWNSSTSGQAYTNLTLTDEDVSTDLVAAQKAQTTAGSDMTYALLNSGEWTGNTGTYGDNGVERYGDEIAVSGTDPVKVLYYTVEDLHPGTYTVAFYAVANNAWVGAAVGNNIAQAFANETVADVEVYDQTVFTDLSVYSHTLTCTVGSDGVLEFGLQNIATGGNWYVAQAVSLTLVALPGEEAIDWTMTEAGWGTLILPFAADVPEGLTAYSCPGLESDETTLTLNEESTLASCTPYILSGADGTYSFTGTPENTKDKYQVGLLVGTLVDMSQNDGDFTTAGTEYVLQNHTEDEGYSEESEAGYGLAFYPVTDKSTGVTLDAYHCYLNTGAVVTALRLPGIATAIEAVESDVIAGDAIYDLSGRKVSKAVKGVYIMNGKKVLVK